MDGSTAVHHDRRTATALTDTLSETYSFSVPFFDVDSMNIVWHGHYCKYMELARCKLLDKIGYSYRAMAESGYSFPIIDMSIKYIKPMVFDQSVVVTAILLEWQYRLKIAYCFRDAQSQARLAKAHTVQATVAIASNTMRLQCPDTLREKVDELTRQT